MATITGEFEASFPLLEKMLVATESSPQKGEPLPPFLGFMLAAADSSDERSCCFVLPDATHVAFMSAVMISLTGAEQSFPRSVQDYADANLQYGHRVLVLPHRYVYVYRGICWADRPLFVGLEALPGVQAKKAGIRSFPVDEIMRLEPTTRKEPRGTLTTPLGHSELSFLDRLLEISSGGNRSLLRNRVLFLTSKARFKQLLGSTVIYYPETDGNPGTTATLADILPWGSIDEDGNLSSSDPYQILGEPLLAVTHRVEYLAEACDRAAAYSRVVVADEPDRVASDLQAFDRINASQKALIVGNHSDGDTLSTLRDRGCLIWQISPEEIYLEQDNSANGRESTFFEKVFRAAKNYKDLNLDTVSCTDSRLDLAAEKLILGSEHLRGAEGQEETVRYVRRLFSLLFQAAEMCAPPPTGHRVEILTEIRELEQALERRAMWTPREVTEALQQACAALRQAFTEEPSVGYEKGRALLGTLGGIEARGDGPVVVISRFQTSAEQVRCWLLDQGVDVPVVTDRHLPADGALGTLVVLSWLNSDRFGRLVQRYVAPNVRLLVYPFERTWAQQFRKRFAHRLSSGRLDAAVKASILDLSQNLLEDIQGADGGMGETTDDPDLHGVSIFDVEKTVIRRRKGSTEPTGAWDDETLPARYVGFVGETYAYLTENHAVPIITGLVNDDAPTGSPVPAHTVNDLGIGDILLFREGSDSDVVRIFAERLVGPEVYAEERGIATSWKESLASLGNVRDVYIRLQTFGLQRTQAAVKGWLELPTLIGPGDRNDLRIIAEAVGEGSLPYGWEQIWESIENVRAGHRISEWLLAEVSQRTDLLRDGETSIDLDFGRFWIVEVEELDNELEQRPASMVNRLLWDSG